ncbi:hypothetical protein ACSEE7_06080 [Halomonas cupida]|uniref:hypothetical protein n=1 Tax=Halomonas cupida TaxID=44933 RepID=UPI003EFA75A6
MDMEEFREEIDKLRNLKRKHASFFDWHDKEAQEKGIGMDFFQKLEESSDEYLLNIESVEDPPDVKITTSKGRELGVEITELVDQAAIEYEIKGDPRYCERIVSWNKENTIELLEAIIVRKDGKCEKVKDRYESLVLLIFTDEPRLESDTLKEYLHEHTWPETMYIDEAYILTGYEPGHGTKCLIRLF